MEAHSIIPNLQTTVPSKISQTGECGCHCTALEWKWVSGAMSWSLVFTALDKRAVLPRDPVTFRSGNTQYDCGRWIPCVSKTIVKGSLNCVEVSMQHSL